jgi:hypothetical protein
LTSLYYNE